MTEQVDISSIMSKATCAAAVYSQLDQAHTDRIVRAVYKAGFNNRVRLAKMACDETGIGIWEDKVLKNVVATQLVYEDVRNLKTVGIISHDKALGISEIAQPLGPIFAIIPMTNPTSTTLFKILISLKTRNTVIISPHHRAANCVIETARICYEAAMSEDAPEDCIQWLTHTSRELTHEIMAHKDLALILATGGGGLVKAAYSSGTPALGVGAGNVPVFIERTADLEFAVENIIISKTFDNGTVCASEQAIVAERCIADELIDRLKSRHCYFLSDDEVKRIEAVAFDPEKGVMSGDIVGKSVAYIARKAGVEAPADVQLLIAPLKGVGVEYPLSSELLAPILAFYIVDDYDSAVNLCIDLNFHGGIGHTASIFSNDEEKIEQFALVMNAGRIVVNMPSSQGAVGGITNTLNPSLTLGCGTGGKNMTTDNITARHLLNIQRIARRRTNERFEKIDKSKYFDESLNIDILENEYNRNY